MKINTIPDPMRIPKDNKYHSILHDSRHDFSGTGLQDGANQQKSGRRLGKSPSFFEQNRILFAIECNYDKTKTRFK
jgi:hypothetical protein